MTRFEFGRGRSAAIAAGIGLACVFSVGSALAGAVTYAVMNNPDETSFFAVDFGDGQRSAEITTTRFRISVDVEAGSASFLSYYQQADPILLPGGVSTGRITIATDPALSSGTVYEQDGLLHFSITDTYIVAFEADLSMFGLFSPQYVTSTSSGTIKLDGNGLGEINADWAGQGSFGDPQQPTFFDYICQVRTTILPQPLCWRCLPWQAGQEPRDGGPGAEDLVATGLESTGEPPCSAQPCWQIEPAQPAGSQLLTEPRR